MLVIYILIGNVGYMLFPNCRGLHHHFSKAPLSSNIRGENELTYFKLNFGVRKTLF